MSRPELIDTLQRLPLPDDHVAFTRAKEALAESVGEHIAELEGTDLLGFLCELGAGCGAKPDEPTPCLATPDNVLAILSGDNQAHSCELVAHALLATTRQTGRVLAKLVKAGKVEASGSGRGKRYKLAKGLRAEVLSDGQADMVAGGTVRDGEG